MEPLGVGISLALTGLMFWYGPVGAVRALQRWWIRHVVHPAIINAKKVDPEMRKPSVQRESFLVTEELTTLDDPALEDPMLDDPMLMDLTVVAGEEDERWL